ncbi:MAG: sugar phosphate nucleotidyltransferase, partial [Pseudomonadota bacterium]
SGTPSQTPAAGHHQLPRYDLDAMLIEVELLFDWYLRWPGQGDRTGVDAHPSKDAFLQLWRAALLTLSDDNQWVVRDFHSPNLLILPEEKQGATAHGPAPQLGVIDFQDAVAGPAVYDLVSLLQDARVDVPPEDENDLFGRYLSAVDAGTTGPLTLNQRIALRRDYALLGAQRATKILGIFARLSMRDGKDTYLAHIPRVYRYLQRNLRHPALHDLAAWYARHIAPPTESASAQATPAAPMPATQPTPMPAAAFVLCGGLGTRMRPLTDTAPKPLIKVCGRSMLDRILDRFLAAGINHAVVNAHYLAEQIDSAATSRTAPVVRVSDERRTLLDTGGGAARARSLLPAGPFFIHNADSLWFDPPAPQDPETPAQGPSDTGVPLPGAQTLRRMAAAFDPQTMDTLLLLVPRGLDSGYRGAGDFLLDDRGQLIRRGERAEAPYVFAGVSIVAPRFFDSAPHGSFSLNHLWDQAIAKGRAHGLVHDGPWLHIGDPQALADAERQMRQNGWC